ncbi:hypothetical protein MHU86_6824 [Fragilaria crotonensis]|nr:hypothetical protein MHU86_6824 [Fragilaria crotonensis]
MSNECYTQPSDATAGAPNKFTGASPGIDLKPDVEVAREDTMPESAAPGARSSSNNNNNHIVNKSTGTVVEAKTMQSPHQKEQTKWHERPWRRSILLLLILIVVVVIIVVVLVLTKTIGGASTAAPTEGLQIACNFIGQPSWTDCQNDRVVVIGPGSYESTIPTEIGLLTQVTYMYFARPMTGTIPSTISQMTLLSYLSFSDSQLTGTIPSSISQLTRLTGLSFYDNLLTGTIPSSFSQLTLLNYLSFIGNELSGTIPSSLCDHVNELYIDCGIECACCIGSGSSCV